MSDTTTPRYGHDPKVAFAATLAGAERRRAREALAAAAATERSTERPVQRLIRRLTARLATTRS